MKDYNCLCFILKPVLSYTSDFEDQMMFCEQLMQKTNQTPKGLHSFTFFFANMNFLFFKTALLKNLLRDLSVFHGQRINKS